MRPSRPSRGFTLIELMMALAVSAVVLVAVVAASNAQQRLFNEGQHQRASQGSARMALLWLEQKLPTAGWGIDPSLALDFQYYTGGPCPLPSACTRDNNADTDELVFYARNPNYWVPPEGVTAAYVGRVWNLSAITSSSASLDLRGGEVFPQGQILQAVCPGELKYAYFTVGATVPAAGGTPLSAGTTTIQLAAVDTANPFKRQDVAVATALTGCRVFQVDRYRIHVRPVAVGGVTTPYLMLDRGIDANQDGTIDDKDETVLAEGIEAFQVGYELANPALGSVGTTSGTAITWGTVTAANQQQATAGAILLTNFGSATGNTAAVYTPSSFYSYRYSDPIRQTAHQANIRAVQLSLVARSPTPNPTAVPLLVTGYPLLNQAAAPSWVAGLPKTAHGTDGYDRTRADTTVNLPNMTVRSITGF